MHNDLDALAWEAAAQDPRFRSEVGDIEAAYRRADIESWVEADPDSAIGLVGG